MLEDRIKVINQ